jgi:hypothetical protein
MSYSRKRRLFTKPIVGQFKQIQDASTDDTFLYSSRLTKLREYSEELFLASGMKQTLSMSDYLMALMMSSGESKTSQMLSYATHLGLSSLSDTRPTHFSGHFECSVCGGDYHKSDEGYSCSGCGYKGRSDIYGFPVSFPASSEVRKGRTEFHELLKSLKRTGLSMQDCYQLIAFESKLALPLAHAGLCTTETEINQLINGCKIAISKTRKGQHKETFYA